MTEPTTIAALQAQLAQQREVLGRLLLRFAVQASRGGPHPRLLRGLVEIRADLAETKARLRLLGVLIEDWPDDAEDWTALAQARPVALDTPEHAALHSQLERQRAFLALLLRRTARAGLQGTSREILHAIAEVRAEIAQTKALLVARGVEAAEHPDDTPLARASKAAGTPQPPPSPYALSPDQRAALLAQLARRYQEQWERTLLPQSHLPLRLRDRSAAVDPTWQGLRPHVARLVPSSKTLLEAFEAHQQLLVLGEAGTGKTTLLLELALALTQRALADAEAPIPLLLNLASAPAQPILLGWLFDALPAWLALSPKQTDSLASGNEVALLLDGLDEVPTDQQALWVETISAAATACDPLPLLVACDSRAYGEIGARLELNGAIELEALVLGVVEQALGAAPAAKPLLAALRSCAGEPVGAPLLVHLVLLAGDQAPPAEGFRTLEAAYADLWGAFLRRALSSHLPYLWEPRQVLRALRWQAQHLHAKGLIAFPASVLPRSLMGSASQRAVLSATGLLARQARALLERLRERGVLEREGRCYRFRHVLLRDWCAALSDAEIEALAAQLQGRS